MTRNLTNMPLAFLTHKDSIPYIYEVKEGIVVIDNDSINLKDSINLYFETSEFYRNKIKTYLLFQPNSRKGIYITLDFCYDRLFQINLFSNKSYYLSNFKLEFKRHFKKNGNSYFNITTDSTINYGNKIVSYGERYSEYNSYGSNKFLTYHYREDLIKGNGYLILADKKLTKLIPSWCGTCNGNRTWEKLKAYIDKNVH